MISSESQTNCLPELLRFQPAFFERIWGGKRLERVLGFATPQDKTIGEAWLISDHAQHESVVAEGVHVGRTLRELLTDYPDRLLGKRASLTCHGRFPLLLKLIDSGDVLSVQVHPDDDTARRLGEPDVGKTEMWHCLDAEPESALICGLDPTFTAEQLMEAIGKDALEQAMTRFEAPPGTSVYVPAGTVHAIGGGILLAEIQQNSDLTYRLYDWGRRDSAGQPRPLHIDKAIQSIHFGSGHGGPARQLEIKIDGARCSVLAACRYFAAFEWSVPKTFVREMPGDSFHIVLAKEGGVDLSAGNERVHLRSGECVLIPGCSRGYSVQGPGRFLEYFVPDLDRDIVLPLEKSGYARETLRDWSGLGEAVRG